MIKKDIISFADGSKKTHIRVVESYRPGPGQAPKQRTIEDFGYLENQDDQDAFMEKVHRFNSSYKEQNLLPRIEATGTAKMYCDENHSLNYGYKFFEAIYDMLAIDSFINNYLNEHRFKGHFSPAAIFKFLVIKRLLYPDSKRASVQTKNNLYGMTTDFDLHDVYRSLDIFSGFEVEIQRHLNEKVKEKIGRDLSHAFYDVTNYFFEIDFPDGEDDLRKKGVSKEHRVDPIVGMGLLMDKNALPVCMSIFPGNTSESLTLIPTMNDVKESYHLGRLVIVADKGLNSLSNINAAVNAGDGFVFSQILKGKKGSRFHERMFAPDGWTANEKGTYKYKLFIEDYEGKDCDGQIVKRKRKVLLYWDKADAIMASRKRAEKLERAEKSVKNNAYGIKKGVDEYTKETIVDKGTGEILDDAALLKERSVNIEKAEKDARFDGYFCIITSELDYDEKKIRQVYGGLWRIEQSFRMMKSDLYARPVFVYKNEHIRAHFLICFVALLVVRIMQHRMGCDALSAERITRALGAANLRLFKNGVVLLDDVGGYIAFEKTVDKKGKTVATLELSDEDEIALDYKEIQKLFGTDCYNIWQRQEVFNRFLRKISLALQ